MRTSLHSENGNGRCLCDGRDKTREQQDVVDKGEERTDCPSFKAHLKIQERWSESSCHSLQRGWTFAFWYYSYHFQTKRPPPLYWAEFFLGRGLGAPASSQDLGLRAASRLQKVRLA